MARQRQEKILTVGEIAARMGSPLERGLNTSPVNDMELYGGIAPYSGGRRYGSFKITLKEAERLDGRYKGVHPWDRLTYFAKDFIKAIKNTDILPKEFDLKFVQTGIKIEPGYSYEGVKRPIESIVVVDKKGLLEEDERRQSLKFEENSYERIKIERSMLGYSPYRVSMARRDHDHNIFLIGGFEPYCPEDIEIATIVKAYGVNLLANQEVQTGGDK